MQLVNIMKVILLLSPRSIVYLIIVIIITNNRVTLLRRILKMKLTMRGSCFTTSGPTLRTFISINHWKTYGNYNNEFYFFGSKNIVFGQKLAKDNVL